MVASTTCRETVIQLFDGLISSFTLNGILSQLGELGEVPVRSLSPQAALWLRRRVDRLCRSYLEAHISMRIMQNLDSIFASYNIQLPEVGPATSGTFPAIPITSELKTQRIGGIQPNQNQLSPPDGLPTIANQLKSPPPSSLDSTTPAPSPQTPSQTMAPAVFVFRSDEELHALQVELHKALTSYLRDTNVVRRLILGLERAARAALVNGEGEIRLERDAGLRGRLVFSVRSNTGQTCLSGAVFAAGLS